MTYQISVHTTDQMTRCGELLGATLKGGEIIVLTGELGAGKTTFTQGIAMGLGVKERVTSPSFALIHVHEGRLKLVHCDFYRLNSSEEIESLGFYDYIDPQNVIVIEWGERYLDHLPPETMSITIDQPGGIRTLTIKPMRSEDGTTIKEWISTCPY